MQKRDQPAEPLVNPAPFHVASHIFSVSMNSFYIYIQLLYFSIKRIHVEGSGQSSEAETGGGLESEVPGAQNAAPHAPVGMPAGLSEKPPSKR